MLNSPPERNELAPLNGAASHGVTSHGVTSHGATSHGAAPNGMAVNGAAPYAPAVAVAHPVSHASDTESLDVGALLAALWRRKGLMLTTFALVTLLGTFLTMRQHSIYEATCSILISAPSSGGAAGGDSLRALLESAQPRSVGTQLAIMRSYPVQRATLKRLPPAEQEIARAFNTLDVRPQRDSEAIDIVAQSYDPKVAANLANALSTEYMAQAQVQNKQQVAAGTREVAAQLAGARQRLDAADSAIKNFKMGQGTVNLAEESSARLAQVNQIEVALRDLQAERAASVAQVQAAKNQMVGQPRIQVTPDRIVRSQRVEALRTQLTQLDVQRITTAGRYHEGSPELRFIDTQRAKVQNQLQTATKTEISSWTRNANPIVQSAMQDMARAQTAIASTDARIAALKGAETRARAQEALLPERQYRLGQLENDQTTLQQTYQLLNQKYNSLLVSEGSKLTTATVFAPAEAPQSPVKPRRSLSIAMSVLLGAFLATALALLADKMDDRVRSAQSAQNAARLPVLAQIPAGPAPSSDLVHSQLSPLAPESFRLLRTNLLLPGMGGASSLPRSILVAGVGAGEDASGCALNLALAIAQSGKEVILIEADMRHPILHASLGLSPSRGLSEVLRGEALESAVQVTGVPQLRFLSGGMAPAGAAELLGSDAARQILQAAMARADCAVLSGPPVLSGADTPILATIAQSALLVVSSNHSQSSDIAQAREILARTGIALPGVVLDGVQPV